MFAGRHPDRFADMHDHGYCDPDLFSHTNRFHNRDHFPDRYGIASGY
jgi:hypothetical protein